jgi:rhamnosyltransferase
MLSTDVFIRSRSWLRTLLKSFADPLVAGVYGRQVPKEDATPMERFFIEHTYPLERKVQHLKPGERIRDFFFSNTNSAIRRDVWRKIPLPEMLKSEDQEWAKRAILAGYKIIYDPEAVVHHSHHYTLKQVFKEYFDSGATLPFVYDDSRIEAESFLTKGLKFEHDEIKYFMRNGYAKNLPYAFAYDFFKFVGYSLGTR